MHKTTRFPDFTPPFWLPNGHFQSIFPSLFRKVEGVHYTRERIVTPDDDFLDLDFSFAPQLPNTHKNSLVILSHGLEGSASRQYIMGMVKILNRAGFDCLAWNFRSCSGEMNRQKRFYHSGATDDLCLVISHCLLVGYKSVRLVGFSLGGNLTLKYLGEQGQQAARYIEQALTFSVPLHLSSSSDRIAQPDDFLYTYRFNRTLKKKVVEKAQKLPNEIDTSWLEGIRTLRDFDEHYTSKLHGFAGAEDYYEQNSALYFLDGIRVPTLIVNAQNDPFLSPQCFPYEALKSHASVSLLAPTQGGHCGFYQQGYRGFLWSEELALAYFGVANNNYSPVP